MRKILVTLLFLFLVSPLAAFSQESKPQSFGFLSFQNNVPTEIVSVDPVNGRMVQALVSVDTFFIGNFTPGQSDTFDPHMVSKFDEIIANVKPDQHIFFRGTADPMRWSNRYSEVEFMRLNLSLAHTRAMWAKERAGLGEFLNPVIDYPGRGVIIYVATYDVVENGHEARVDTLIVITQTHSVDTIVAKPDNEFRVGVGAGYTGVFNLKDQHYNVPTLNFTFEFNRRYYVDLIGGYRPKDASDDPEAIPGQRSESVVAVIFSWYPEAGPFGIAAGYLAAYENVRQKDEFLERNYGLIAGPRFRIHSDHFYGIVGLDFGYFDVSKFGAFKSRRSVGVAPNIRLQYVF